MGKQKSHISPCWGAVGLVLLAATCSNPLYSKAVAAQAKEASPVVVVSGSLGTPVPDRGVVDVGTVSVNAVKDTTLTIANTGASVLEIGGVDLTVGTGESGSYTLSRRPAATVKVGESTTCVVRFSALAVGPQTATLTIRSNDVTTPVYRATVQAHVTTAPTGLTGAPSNGWVSLYWDKVTGADSYTLYWSANPGVTKGNGTAIGALTSPGYNHQGLTNGTTYYYVVTATIGGVEYDASPQVAVSPANVVSPPQTPTIVNNPPTLAGVGNVSLHWVVPANGTAAFYTVYQSTASNLTTTNFAHRYTNITGLDYLDAAAVPGVRNYYLVTATNAGGESSPMPLSIVVQPDPATGITGTPSYAQVSLSWTAPVPAVSSYSIYRSTISGFATVDGNKVGTATGTAFTDVGLSDLTTYYYKVVATNEAGTSLVSAESSWTTPKTLAFVVNYTSNTVWSYTQNYNTGLLTKVVSTPTETGPLTAAATPDRKYLYVLNYGSKSITAYTINWADGTLTLLGRTDTVYTPLDMKISPNGKFLFTNNTSNGYGDVASWVINANGSLTKATLNTPSKLACSYLTTNLSPSSLVVSPDSAHVYTTGYSSSVITRFDVSPTGLLTTGTTSAYQSTAVPYVIGLAIHPSGIALYVTEDNGKGLDTALVNTATGVVSALANYVSAADVCPNTPVVDPLGKCLFFRRGDYNTVLYTKIAPYSGSATNGYVEGTYRDSGLVSAWEPCFDPNDTWVYVATGNTIQVAAVAYSSANVPTFTVNSSTMATGSGPRKMVLVRQPGY